jgi:DNA-binding MarR family transcriptional regulator
MAAVPTPLPTVNRLAAWEALLRAHATLLRALDAELQAGQGLSIGDYDVLITLAKSPDRRLRMRELADRVILSRSGITRRIDRLESDGLVRREPAPDDGRSVAAVLTDAGWERLREASATHVAGIEERFLARYSDEELQTIAALLERVGSDVDVVCDAG